MHAVGTLTTLALFLGAANAHCWGGYSMHRNTIKREIGAACNDGRLQGTYGVGESKKVCVNIEDPHVGSLGSIDLEIRTPNDSNGRIGSADCEHQLNKLVDYCYVAAGPLSYGGEDTVSGWYFKADPNANKC